MPEANAEYGICVTSPNLVKFVNLITNLKVGISDRDTVQPMSYCVGTHRHINMRPISYRKTGKHTNLRPLIVKLFRNETGNQTRHIYECNS